MTEGFEFAVVAEDTAFPAWPDAARRAEDLGYHAVLVTDHVTDPVAALPALCAAALATRRLQVGTFVLNNDLRHPVLVARDFAALHALSAGRSILGLGAGWAAADYAVTGIPRDRGATRLARLAESVAILQALFAGGPVKTDGAHYRVRADAELIAARGGARPRLLLGGGRRGTLELAAREADVVSLVPPLAADGIADAGDLSGERVDAQVAVVRAAAIGRDDPPKLNHVVWECLIARRPQRIREAVARAYGLTEEGVRSSPCLLVGTAAEVTELLLERRERWGFSFVTVPAAALETFAPVVDKLAAR